MASLGSFATQPADFAEVIETAILDRLAALAQSRVNPLEEGGVGRLVEMVQEIGEEHHVVSGPQIDVEGAALAVLETIADARALLPYLAVVEVPDTNHYLILLGDREAGVVADEIRRRATS